MKQISLISIVFLTLNLYAQNITKDTLKLEEVIITATKTKKQLSDVTVPVTLIKNKAIQEIAAIKLQDVLAETTGINLQHSALGVGIQLQGLDADYTLVMVNGKPLVGRLNGLLDLSRLPTENIAQIEIVKGPSSVLYGSDALAGVINIITKEPLKSSLKIGTKLSSFNTQNLFSNISLIQKKITSEFFINYYKTDGYTLNSNYQGYDSSSYYNKTISPHSNYSLNNTTTIDFSKNLKLNLLSAYFKENQDYDFIQNNEFVQGDGTIEDWSISPNLEFNLIPKLKSRISYHFTKYKTVNTEKFVNTNENYSDAYFNQDYHQIEIQNDYSFIKNNKTSLGLGFINETVSTSKLFNNDKHKTNNTYAFLQHQLKIKEKWNFVLGARIEKHDAYTNQFNPKFSFLYRIKPTFHLRGSIGRGFKKPTFKQLFFNYTNAAIGYTVLGTTFVEQGIQELLANNQIAINPENNEPVIYNLYNEILQNNGVIEPESSLGYNLGFKITALTNTTIDINIFRNDLKNLIDTTPIALKTNGWQVYSYQNLKRVFTNGFDIAIKHQLSNTVNLSLGYQFLDAKDKDILDQIKNEGIFAQDEETLQSYRISEKDYGGLFNRSKHTANFKVKFYDIYKGINANIRFLFTGKYGFADLNNNAILDLEKEYTDNYMLVNTTISKAFLNQKLKLKVGIDNILDFTYVKPDYTITSLPGRTFYTTINYTF